MIKMIWSCLFERHWLNYLQSKKEAAEHSVNWLHWRLAVMDVFPNGNTYVVKATVNGRMFDFSIRQCSDVPNNIIIAEMNGAMHAEISEVGRIVNHTEELTPEIIYSLLSYLHYDAVRKKELVNATNIKSAVEPMDTYQLIELLIKMRVFSAPKEKFAIKDYLVTLYTKPEYDGNRLEVSQRHPELTGAFIPWYSYDHGDTEWSRGHQFHGPVINAQILRSVLAAFITKWYNATDVDIMSKPGTYLMLIDYALRLDPEFRGHVKTVQVDISKASHWADLPIDKVQEFISASSNANVVNENPWGQLFTPYPGGIHVNAKLKAPIKMAKSYRDAVADLAKEEKLRFHGLFYKPQKDEPSPFGEKAVGVNDHPWVVWRAERYSTPVGAKGEEHRQALIAALESEPLRPINSISLVNCERERNGHLTLGWVICMFYNFGGKTWEEIHQVGVARNEYYREHGHD